MRRLLLIALAVVSLHAMPARAESETHRAPWDGQMCTPVEVSIAHADLIRLGGCTLDNPLSAAGFVVRIPPGPSCPPGHGGCANVTPHWAGPADTYSAPAAGTGRIDIVGTPGICLDIGTHRGDLSFGSDCGPSVTFTVPSARTVFVGMRGPGFVYELTYTFPA